MLLYQESIVPFLWNAHDFFFLHDKGMAFQFDSKYHFLFFFWPESFFRQLYWKYYETISSSASDFCLANHAVPHNTDAPVLSLSVSSSFPWNSRKSSLLILEANAHRLSLPFSKKLHGFCSDPLWALEISSCYEQDVSSCLLSSTLVVPFCEILTCVKCDACVQSYPHKWY